MNERQKKIETECFALGAELRERMKPGVGFALLLYHFGPDGFCAYTGNGNREDTIKLLREHLRMLETNTQ